MGAAAVFETAAETPPIRKSATKGGMPRTVGFSTVDILRE
jgi:hypothetical protein